MAKLHRPNGATSVTLRVNIQDTSSSVGAGKTGLTEATAGLIIASIADVEATTTRYRASSGEIETIATLGTFAAPTAGKCRFRELDATNHPGLYEIQLADARWAVAGAKSVIVTVSGAAGMAMIHSEIQQEPAPANVTQWLGVTAPANTGDAFARIGAPAGASVSADVAAVKTQTASIETRTTDLQARVPAALVGGKIDATVAGGLTSGDLAPLAKSTELAPLAKSTELAPVAKTTDLGPVAKTTDLAPLARTTDLAPVAKSTELAPLARTTDLAPVAKTVDLAAVNGGVVSIKGQTDKLAFTVAGAVDANISHVIGDAVQRDGANDTNWGGAP